MRRGHPGISGWRGDTPRHFRPRGGGTQHFRGPRIYNLLDGPRFQHPGPRFQGPGSYNNDDHFPEHHDRGNYRGSRQSRPMRPPDRKTYPPRGQGPRQIFPLLQRMRHNDAPDHKNTYNDKSNYYDNPQKPVNVGDVDHRLGNTTLNREPFNPRPSPWIIPPFAVDRGSTNNYQHQSDEHNKVPQTEYGSSHRPPSSDFHGGPPGSTIDSSNTFSRSVDDTVSIVRKRLLSRESQHSSESTQINPIEIEQPRQPMPSTFSNTPHEQMAKKKSHKSMNVKSNCAKIKNKIIHQLFMMDKDKIHKLMDNPNSSSKFEYAISTLVMESQNSYNRHLRSAAEKSLCSSSTEFLHNDNNTIYEDTFMKQMQCLLEPQDTVLLEDMKPIVLAELCKVLQINDLEQRYDDEASCSRDEQIQFNKYGEPYDYDNNHQQFSPYSSVDEGNYYEKEPQPRYERSVSPPNYENESKTEFGRNTEKFDSTHLFERRKSRRSRENLSRRSSSEHRRKERRSMDCNPEDNYRRSRTPVHLFDGNSEQFSEEDDPFAELDRQYHVAVDHNFIESYDITTPPQSVQTIPDSPEIKREIKIKADTPEKPIAIQIPNAINIKSPDISDHIKKEIDSQLQDMAKSTLKLSTSVTLKFEDDPIKKLETSPVKQFENLINKSSDSVFTQEETPEAKPVETTTDKSVIPSRIKTSTPSLPRKRSADQRPSHRKEKRKKSESSQPDPNKYIFDKKVIVKVADCVKSKQKSDAAIPVFNFFQKIKDKSKESLKDNKKVDNVDKGHSDKHDKRKDSSKKLCTKEKDSTKNCDSIKDKEVNNKKKNDSSSSSHSILSPSDTSISQTPTKTDGHTKLKPIDMFVENPRKPNAHPGPRNTAPAFTPPSKGFVVTKPIILNRNSCKRHVATQVLRKCVSKEVQTNESKPSTSRFCQTDRKRFITRGAQTDPVSFKSGPKSTDTFERMKEIDMEIQALLQEKFKLYNSLESKESCVSTMNSLGMAVLAPTQSNDDENDISEDVEDAIVEDFTNIPEEELEQIALETVQEQTTDAPVAEKRSRRLASKAVETNPISSLSPTTITNSTRSKKKSKTPNISLIEQIITDDRPLEDIISLDDLETPPPKSSKKKSGIHKPKPLDDIILLDPLETPPPRSSKKKSGIHKPKPLDDITLLDPLETPPPRSSKKKSGIQKPKPLEDIILLDDLETPLPKSSKKKSGVHKPKKKSTSKKAKVKFVSNLKGNNIKECLVVLIREDIAKMLRRLVKKPDTLETVSEIEKEPKKKDGERTVTPIKIVNSKNLEPQIMSQELETAAVDTVENDLQFDMLDVSEDIVIGDVCEVKSSNEKDSSNPSICEEIILDNSQSSLVDAATEDSADNECKTYDYSADENLRRDCTILSGNGDAILAIECLENAFLAASLDGNVYHFSTDGQLLNTLRGSNLAVTCLTIVTEPLGTTVYTGSLDSRIRYYDLETGLEKGPECNVLSPIQTMDRAWDTVFVGTRTGFVLQFECKNNMLIPITTVKFSEQSILSLRAIKEGPRKVLLVAARSENVTIKDAQTGLLLRTLEGPKMTVYTLLFEEGKVYCGTSSHQIHVFDYASGSHVYSHESGKGVVCLRALGGLLFAGCYDGCVYVYREGGGGRARAQLRGPTLMLLSLAVLGTKIIAGYKDRSLYIWKIPLAILQEMIL